MKNLAILDLRPAKTEEVSPAAQVNLLSSFLNLGKQSFWQKIFLEPKKTLSLEMASIDQKTHFLLAVPANLKSFFSGQVLAQYPKTLLTELRADPLKQIVSKKRTALGYLTLNQNYNYPLKTFKDCVDLPPLSSIIGFLAKLSENEAAHIQILLRVVDQTSTQNKVRSTMKIEDAEGKTTNNPYNSLIQRKLSQPFMEAQVRILFSSPSEQTSKTKLNEFAGSFGIYTLSEGNSIIFKKIPAWFKKNLFMQIVKREFFFWEPKLVLNLEEAASLWHLPDKKFEKIKNINWGKTLLSEAPDNLPVASINKLNKGEKRSFVASLATQDDKGVILSPSVSEDEESQKKISSNHNINYFGKTEWRNREEIFGVKEADRGKHIYIIGKTGAGKSTLIANMAINDIRNGQGVAVIDPHGDLSEMILDYIPKRRLTDVIYLDPTLSAERSFSLNLFDKEASEHTDVVASGIVSVFYKLYGNSWGPRLEYILRNTIMTMLYYGEGTFADIPKLLANKPFREKVVAKIKTADPIIAAFWEDEYEKMTDKLRAESISPIQNKVGQFLSSLRIRKVVDAKHSTFSFEEVMNKGKILILNLSQGKLGEDTTALLGAMFITKMQLTAMRRVNLPENERRNFYLYVDEFQNFATGSFIKILSEARKYHLNLILANQYVGQVDEDIQKAIFGNVGTLITFIIGAADAALFQREFGNKFTADDLVGLGKYEILLKMAIDGLTCEPFYAKTLPLPSVRNENKEKIIRLSLEKYYKKHGK